MLQASRQASSRGLILLSWRRLLVCALAHSHTWERLALLDRAGHRFAHKRDKALAVLGIGDAPVGEFLRAAERQECGLAAIDSS